MLSLAAVLLTAVSTVTFGTDTRDVPVSARILEDGSCAMVLQCSPESGEMYYAFALAFPGEDEAGLWNLLQA